MTLLVITLLVGILLNNLGVFSCIAKKKSDCNEGRRQELEKLEIMDMENSEMNEKVVERTKAVTIGERVQTILKSQGIESELDEDGDILFEYHFKNFLLEEARGTDFFCLSVGYRMELDEQNMMRFLKVANQLHFQYRMVRMACLENGIKFMVEALVFPEMDIKRLLSFSLTLLDAAIEESSKLFREFDEGMNHPNEERRPASIIGFHEAREQMLEEKEGREAYKQETAEKRPSQGASPSIGFNSSRYK